MLADQHSLEDLAQWPKLEIAGHIFEASRNIITKDQVTVQIEPRLCKVLAALCLANPKTISRADLLEQVWPDVVVTEISLTRAISDLRKIFDDSTQAPAVIETVRKVGYRLMVAPEQVEIKSNNKPQISSEQQRRWWIPLLGAALCLVGVNFLMSRSKASSFPELRLFSAPIKANYLTWESGREMWPALSKNGDWLIFTRSRDGQTDIFKKQLKDQAESHQLTTDGKPKAFLATTPLGSIYFLEAAESERQIKKINVDGSQVKIRDFPNKMSGLEIDHEEENLFYSEKSLLTGRFEIKRWNLKSEEETTLLIPPPSVMGDFFPKLSPDQSKLLFLRQLDFHRAHLLVLHLQSGKVQQVKTMDASIRSATWIDEENILVCRQPGDPVSAYKTSLKGNLEILPFREGNLSLAQVAPRIVTAVKDEFNVDIHTYSKDGEAEELISSGDMNTQPSWSHNGERLVYLSNRTGTTCLWLANGDGSQARPFNPNETAKCSSPVWSPDDQKIAFLTVEWDRSKIWVTPSDVYKPKLMAELQVPCFISQWHPQENKLLTSKDINGQWNLFELDLDTLKQSQKTFQGGYKGLYAGDGSLVYSKSLDHGLYRTKQKMESLIMGDLCLDKCWDVRENQLAYINPQWEIHVMNLETRSSQKWGDLPISIYLPTGLKFHPQKGDLLMCDTIKGWESDIVSYGF